MAAATPAWRSMGTAPSGRKCANLCDHDPWSGPSAGHSVAVWTFLQGTAFRVSLVAAIVAHLVCILSDSFGIPWRFRGSFAFISWVNRL